MSYMFYECYLVENIYFSNTKTKNWNKVEYMFYQYIKVENLDLQRFDTSNITIEKY